MIGILNKTLALFLFTPIICLSQQLDFHDIKQISSEESFKRIALENLFSKVNMSTEKHPADLIYGYNVTGYGDNARATTWAT